MITAAVAGFFAAVAFAAGIIVGVYFQERENEDRDV